ncbi:MAG: hypothetical protein LBR07_08535 [Puniceicoccales bacterium]|jgi:hypothetical protein|nr:hypothetical protein [Puniceicoccales bacterium]
MERHTWSAAAGGAAAGSADFQVGSVEMRRSRHFKKEEKQGGYRRTIAEPTFSE